MTPLSDKIANAISGRPGEVVLVQIFGCNAHDAALSHNGKIYIGIHIGLLMGANKFPPVPSHLNLDYILHDGTRSKPLLRFEYCNRPCQNGKVHQSHSESITLLPTSHSIPCSLQAKAFVISVSSFLRRYYTFILGEQLLVDRENNKLGEWNHQCEECGCCRI